MLVAWGLIREFPNMCVVAWSSAQLIMEFNRVLTKLFLWTNIIIHSWGAPLSPPPGAPRQSLALPSLL